MIIWQQKQTNENINKILQTDSDIDKPLQLFIPIKRYAFYDTMDIVNLICLITGLLSLVDYTWYDFKIKVLINRDAEARII